VGAFDLPERGGAKKNPEGYLLSEEFKKTQYSGEVKEGGETKKGALPNRKIGGTLPRDEQKR